MNAIYHDFTISVRPEEVFKALTEPRQLEAWWPQTCSGKPGLGAEYNFFFDEFSDWYAKISFFELNKSVHYKMTEASADWEHTTFGFDLKKMENGTHISFTHRNWPAVNDEFKEMSFNWAMLLSGLKSFLDKGEIIPYEDRI